MANRYSSEPDLQAKQNELNRVAKTQGGKQQYQDARTAALREHAAAIAAGADPATLPSAQAMARMSDSDLTMALRTIRGATQGRQQPGQAPQSPQKSPGGDKQAAGQQIMRQAGAAAANLAPGITPAAQAAASVPAPASPVTQMPQRNLGAPPPPGWITQRQGTSDADRAIAASPSSYKTGANPNGVYGAAAFPNMPRRNQGRVLGDAEADAILGPDPTKQAPAPVVAGAGPQQTPYGVVSSRSINTPMQMPASPAIAHNDITGNAFPDPGPAVGSHSVPPAATGKGTPPVPGVMPSHGAPPAPGIAASHGAEYDAAHPSSKQNVLPSTSSGISGQAFAGAQPIVDWYKNKNAAQAQEEAFRTKLTKDAQARQPGNMAPAAPAAATATPAPATPPPSAPRKTMKWPFILANNEQEQASYGL